jgi:hypothetical protein
MVGLRSQLEQEPWLDQSPILRLVETLDPFRPVGHVLRDFVDLHQETHA